MNTPVAAVVGQLARDLVLSVDAVPGPGTAGDATARREQLGGKGANQAVALARLGVRPRLVAVAGEDVIGDVLLDQARRDGIDVTQVVRRPGALTGLIVELLDADGRWRYVQHLPEAVLLTAHDVEAARGVLESAHAVLVQLQQPPEAALTAARIGHHAGALVVLDGVPPPAEPTPAKENDAEKGRRPSGAGSGEEGRGRPGGAGGGEEGRGRPGGAGSGEESCGRPGGAGGGQGGRRPGGDGGGEQQGSARPDESGGGTGESSARPSSGGGGQSGTQPGGDGGGARPGGDGAGVWLGGSGGGAGEGGGSAGGSGGRGEVDSGRAGGKGGVVGDGGVMGGDVLAFADVVRADEQEATLLLGEAPTVDNARRLLERGPRLVAFGVEGGNLFVWRDGHLRLPLTDERVVDTTGGGDAFTAALTAALLRGEDPATAARWAVAASGATVGHAGGRPDLRPGDLEKRVRELAGE
ncbi:PfkB family carbohydrate kinase [Pseudosporangium ferrugineum]|uniref:PfkB family carbohydrate kinase n=1 Tax=Pseudosporangium ferrugineum TaxID=439699 RepID=UPI001FE55444|nr:PfkB family carbohydrate kinase [Pseudosporangium ferrugineum]